MSRMVDTCLCLKCSLHQPEEEGGENCNEEKDCSKCTCYDECCEQE